MKSYEARTFDDLNNSLITSIKMYYNIHLKGGINDFSYYLSAILQEHLNYQDRLLHPNPPN
ncbi:hypothetical protein ACRYKS_23200 [Escherichia coli]|uniref:hypothetical protein n=1 Tax=Escherichia coli TaxID=562 RepID=UPI003D8A92A6|nr:hypothetical protein [Escherichia coli]HCJ9510005.1 hypothetical protein [Escherichia coli]